MTTRMISLFSLLAMMAQSVYAVTPCHICGDAGNGAMHHPNVILANVGKSCTQISLEVALNKNNKPGNAQCSAQQRLWSGRCCSRTRPAGADPSGGLPPQNIPTVTHSGPFPACSICRDGDYPFQTSMVVNFLYIGEGSCAQYYKIGLEGKIQGHLCDPVRYFAYESCGCGQYNPYFNPNHPLNNKASQAPGSSGGGGGSGNGSANNQVQQKRNTEGDKNCFKMGVTYGGAGAVGCNGQRQRRLKGSSKVKETAVAVVQA